MKSKSNTISEYETKIAALKEAILEGERSGYVEDVDLERYFEQLQAGGVRYEELQNI